ncbi:hypothetical protein IFM89_021131 [Coptis chinensis]|uniref:ABC transmembrane type-1 domain-containing protein n=1 Tax=Coptis chinensis TaxID=261450 RepID=A0A835LVW5_9MAGN|nr:hypothetical protein IFM89_021131 [Coptis chinensis]
MVEEDESWTRQFLKLLECFEAYLTLNSGLDNSNVVYCNTIHDPRLNGIMYAESRVGRARLPWLSISQVFSIESGASLFFYASTDDSTLPQGIRKRVGGTPNFRKPSYCMWTINVSKPTEPSAKLLHILKASGRNTVLMDALSKRMAIVYEKPTIIFGDDVTHPCPKANSSPTIMAKYYMASSRELVHIVNIQKSPVIHLFGESIVGAATIRGFGQEKRFVKRNMYLIDCIACPFFCNIVAIEWLCLGMELLSTFVFAFYMFLLLENKIIFIERIHQHSQLPSEAPLIIEDSRPPSSWPENGTIELTDLKVFYEESLPVVLYNVSCSFLGGKKIGTVGRTGSIFWGT